MSPQNEEASRLLLLAKQDQSAFDALPDAAGVPTALAFFMRSNPSKRHSRLPCICAAWNFKELMISRSYPDNWLIATTVHPSAVKISCGSHLRRWSTGMTIWLLS